MTGKKKNSKAAVKLQIALLFGTYNARELEDTIFEIFNEDSKRENLLPKERERRAILHDTLRNVLRIIDQNHKLKKKLQT